jgi:hypothetical protein
MNNAGPWIEEEASPAPQELPRLQIIHLMMWMVATAAAFIPYRLQERVIARDQRAGAITTAAESMAVASYVVVHGLCYGAILFVGAASLVWTMRGRRFRLAPGHVLACEGVARWLAAMGVWVWLSFREARAWHANPWTWAPQTAISAVFFFWYLALAWRGRESRAWRLALVVLATAPIVGFLADLLSWSFILVGDMIDTGLQGVAIGAALLADHRRALPRHWSHWAAGIASVILAAAQVAYYGFASWSFSS